MTRSRALSGWLLGLTALAVYALWRDDWAGYDPVRQSALIIASVAVGAIFLPELSSDLWDIKLEEIQTLIPPAKVIELQDRIVRSQIDEKLWADNVLEHALLPLLDANRTPHRVIENLGYTVEVHLDQQVELGGDTRVMNRVETLLRGRRTLRKGLPANVVWISIARDAASLAGEFEQEGCLSREVVEIDPTLDDETWRQLVEEHCSSSLVINGATVSGSTQLPPGAAAATASKVVRWYFVSADIGNAIAEGDRRQWTVSFDFVERPECTRFPITFASYYCVGGVQIMFKLYDHADAHDLHHEVYLGRDLLTPILSSYRDKDDLCHELSISTREDSLLWPGSGVSIWWTPRVSPAREAARGRAAGAFG